MNLMEVTPFETESMLNEESILKWKINIKDMSCIRTAAFNPMKNADTKFFFEVWFQRNDIRHVTETACLNVIFRKVPESLVHSKLWFELSVFIYYSDGSLYKDYKSDKPVELAKFTEKTCISAIFDVFQRQGLYTTESKKLSTNKLTLVCRMNFTGHIMSPTSYHSNINALRELKTLTKNFEALYLSSELSDVDIEVGEKTIKSHKFVLAAHSPVFKRMLMQDFEEAKSGRISISDFERDVFERFMKFLYTGVVEDTSFSNFKPLYSLADKYDVQILKQECYKMLTNCDLTEEQIVDILQMAYQYNDDKLKEEAKLLFFATVKKE